MPRKWIIGAVGGNGNQTAATLAKNFGTLIRPKIGILLTGGEPNDNADVKDAALSGCRRARGLMISILAKGTAGVVYNTLDPKRMILLTGQNRWGRDPITGAAADIIVVFDGKAGTLVELAYAAANGRPIVFCGKPPRPPDKLPQDDQEEFNQGLQDAFNRYHTLDPTSIEYLKTALKGCFAPDGSVTRTHVKSPKAALTTIKKWTAGQSPERTNFLGLPVDNNRQVMEDFEQKVLDLSELAHLSESGSARSLTGRW
jgi:uncharacterized protein (TIGR00725 family)